MARGNAFGGLESVPTYNGALWTIDTRQLAIRAHAILFHFVHAAGRCGSDRQRRSRYVPPRRMGKHIGPERAAYRKML